MILTDGIHLVSDVSFEELHAFAASVGLKRIWFQRDHYDILGDGIVDRMLRSPITYEVISTRELVRRRKRCEK